MKKPIVKLFAMLLTVMLLSMTYAGLPVVGAATAEKRILTTGEVFEITTFDDGVFDKEKVEWTSSDASIAKVSKTGTVTATGEGEVTIKAVHGTSVFRYDFIVKKPAFLKSSYSVLKGSKVRISMKDATNAVIAADKIKWSSSNRKAVTISSDGYAKGVKAGTSVITAKYLGKTYTCKMYVYDAKISAKALTLTTGEGRHITLKDLNGKVISDTRIKWSSGNTSIAKIDKNGNVQTLKAGSAVITGVYNSMKYTCKLTVKNAVLSKKTLLLTTGNSAHVTLSNASGKLIDDKLITWTSASKSVASVSAGGTVKGLKAGSTTVYAKYKGKTYSVKITVKNASLTKTSSKIELGKTLRISLKGADKKAISDNQIKWKSADKTIATVSSNGTITAKKVGKTIVSATYRGKTYKCTVTVIRVVCKAKQGCKNYAIAGGDYCKDHTCRLSGCNSPTNYAQWDGTGGNTKYCQNHGCFHSYCTSRKSGTSNYCSSHKCLKSSCDSERKDGKYYCWQHSCRHDGCMSERGTGSLRLYCDYHTCRYNDDGFDCSCESMGSQYGYLCKIHYYCTNPDCNLKRVGKYYCSKHKCRQAGCENANLGASNYYYCRYHH